MPDNLKYPWQAVGWNPDVQRYLDNAEKVTRTVRPVQNKASRASVAIPIALGASRVLPSLTEVLLEVATGTASTIGAIPALSLLFAGDTNPRTEEVLSNSQNEYWRNSGIQAGADIGNLEQYLPVNISGTIPYSATDEPTDITSVPFPEGKVIEQDGNWYAWTNGKWLRLSSQPGTGGQQNKKPEQNKEPEQKDPKRRWPRITWDKIGKFMLGEYVLDNANSMFELGAPSTNFGGPWMWTYNPVLNWLLRRKEHGWPTTPTQAEDYLYLKSRAPERMDQWHSSWNNRLYGDPFDPYSNRIENPIVYDRNGVRQNTAWERDGNLISTGPMSNESLKDEEQQRQRDIAEIKKPASGGTTNNNGKETVPSADDDFVSTGNPTVDKMRRQMGL